MIDTLKAFISVIADFGVIVGVVYLFYQIRAIRIEIKKNEKELSALQSRIQVATFADVEKELRARDAFDRRSLSKEEIKSYLVETRSLEIRNEGRYLELVDKIRELARDESISENRDTLNNLSQSLERYMWHRADMVHFYERIWDG
jgi:hypothetical protein